MRVISSESFLEWIIRWKRGIILLIILIIGFIVYLQQTFIFITVNTSTVSDAKPSLTLLNGNGTRSGVLHIGQIAFIPRDTDRIEATYKKWQTTVKVSPLPWVGIMNVSVNLEPDKNATKVSGGSLGCVVYDKQSATLASYSCGDPTGLSVYKTSTTEGVHWKNEAYLTFPRAYSISHYKNGVIGISNSDVSQLFYADMNTKTVNLPSIPPGMNIEELNSTSVITDQIQDSNHFLLVERTSGTIYFATNTTGNIVEYQRFTIKPEWFDSKNVQCILKGTLAYCYVGWPSADIHSDDEEEAHEHTRSDGRIVTIDFTSDKVEYSSSLVSKNDPIDNLYVDNNSQLYATMGRRFYSVDVTKALTERTIVVPSIGDVSSGPTLYYIADNKLYEFDSKTGQTTLRFTSEHLRLSTINQIDAKVFINAFVKDDPGNLLHTYELTDEPNANPGERLIDKFPIYPDNDQSAIVRMDINANNIHIVLPSYVKLAESNQIVPDEKTFAIAKQESINYLSTKISNLNTYTITFSRADK